VTFSDQDVIVWMQSYLPEPSRSSLGRIEGLTTSNLFQALRELNIDAYDASELVATWKEFSDDETWSPLLARLVTMVDQQRGNPDTPLHIWPDFEDSGACGRSLAFYLFVLCFRELDEYLRTKDCPTPERTATMGVLERHASLHRRKFGTTGVDAAWWMVPTLRGELIHVGSLQFHRVTLGVGTFSPEPWYREEIAAQLGFGFRRGDESLGLHISERTDLTEDALDATFARAREVLGAVWPASQRRLATCQSWLLDDRLRESLPASSNILKFQQRFTLLPEWSEYDGNVLEFVFRQPTSEMARLSESTTLQRAVKRVLLSGGHWRDRIGWIDFDGA